MCTLPNAELDSAEKKSWQWLHDNDLILCLFLGIVLAVIVDRVISVDLVNAVLTLMEIEVVNH